MTWELAEISGKTLPAFCPKDHTTHNPKCHHDNESTCAFNDRLDTSDNDGELDCYR
jgi:hypothetical protein